MNTCPVCNSPPENYKNVRDGIENDCPTCGPYRMPGSVVAVIRARVESDIRAQTLLSHYMRQRTLRSAEIPIITPVWIENVLNTYSLPNPQKQAENLVLWLGKRYQETPDEWVILNDLLPAIVGTKNRDGVSYITRNLVNKGVLENPDRNSGTHFRLTLDGWQYYENLLETTIDSKTAFMAMPFRHQDINKNFSSHYVPAVSQTGFKLERVSDNPTAGSITNKILVDIRRAKFVLAELTHSNLGAYWEAGFAEGLKRPVIYLCKRDWDDGTGPHFDIRNHNTVFWSDDSMPEDMEKLKAMIRATLPDEALLEDPPEMDGAD